jgi:hypothetical protein
VSTTPRNTGVKTVTEKEGESMLVLATIHDADNTIV